MYDLVTVLPWIFLGAFFLFGIIGDCAREKGATFFNVATLVCFALFMILVIASCSVRPIKAVDTAERCVAAEYGVPRQDVSLDPDTILCETAYGSTCTTWSAQFVVDTDKGEKVTGKVRFDTRSCQIE